MGADIPIAISELFRQWAGEEATCVTPLTANASGRQYWRMEGSQCRCVAAVAHDVRENEAFFHFARQLGERGVRVPEVYAIAPSRTAYLQQDLGDVTAYSYLRHNKQAGEEARTLYGRILDDLAEMQRKTRGMDFSCAYPRPSMDRQAYQWDFNYFKYDFLKLLHVPFDEELLERDFATLIDYLLEGDNGFFVHRDFQTRNIMLHSSTGQLYIIDFQGCRSGSPLYDAASLLYSSRCELSYEQRDEQLERFLEQVATLVHSSRKALEPRFYAQVAARMMQAMGAYGYRGLFERKEAFMQALPTAIATLRHLRASHPLPLRLPELDRVMEHLLAMPELTKEEDKLTVRLFSFSYKRGLPTDPGGNGGGHVFDCRALPNPGRYDQYRELCGKDLPVIRFMDSHAETEAFFGHAAALVQQSVDNYVERHFSSLMVCFGCTGGRHRSVYFAERMAALLRQRKDIRVVLRHCEQHTFMDGGGEEQARGKH